MQTLKDRLIELLSSPTTTEFELVNNYPEDNATLFKHVPSGKQFYIDIKYLDDLLLPFVVEISFQLSGGVYTYILPANGYMPKDNYVLMKNKRNSSSPIKTSVVELSIFSDIIQAIDTINVKAEGDNDYMTFIKQVQKYKEANFHELRQLPFFYL